MAKKIDLAGLAVKHVDLLRRDAAKSGECAVDLKWDIPHPTLGEDEILKVTITLRHLRGRYLTLKEKLQYLKLPVKLATHCFMFSEKAPKKTSPAIHNGCYYYVDDIDFVVNSRPIIIRLYPLGNNPFGLGEHGERVRIDWLKDAEVPTEAPERPAG